MKRFTWWGAAALALFGMAPAGAAHPNDVWLAGHVQPAPGTSPSDRHSLVGEEPLQPIPAPPSDRPSPPAYGHGYAAEGMASDVCNGNDYAGNSGDCNSFVNGCDYGCANDGCCQEECRGPGLLDCCRVCSLCGFNVEIGFYFLKPHWQTNQAFSIRTTVGGAFSGQNVDFDYDYSVSPYIALGYTLDNGLGFRVRYWDFQDNASVNIATAGNQTAAVAAPLGIGNTIFGNATATATTNLRIKVWDFEITQQLNCNCWVWNFGGGVRYLHTSQAFNAIENGAVNVIDDQTSSHRFKGVGPTLSLGGQRYLGCSGLSLYGNGRASIMVGDATQRAHESAANGALRDASVQSNWGTLAVSELEIGVAYQRMFGCFTIVGSTGLVGQYWAGMGNAANVDTFNNTGTGQTQNNSIGMAMYGLRASLAFYY